MSELKTKDLKNKSIEELKKDLKMLNLAEIQAKSDWGNAKEKKLNINVKGIVKTGQKTSQKRDIRRSRAKILTLIKEKGK